jgi:tetratricopeptide (TPR) repeat protein
MRRILLLPLAAIFAAAACEPRAGSDGASAGMVPEHAHALVEHGGGVPLYDNLGSHSYRITTSSPEAQSYFDQGLRLTFAFNHAEAIRAFDEAARLDPQCAMCAWGRALALGPNINVPMDEEAAVAANEAIERAMRLAPGANERERALIRALARRYTAVPPSDRAPLDSAYARAMGEVADRFPDDDEAATLHAEALMDLSPWHYWEADDSPRPDTPEILRRLESVLARNPDHPGACHFYIHAVEAAHPERAVPCAERLASLMPGAGHLVHMPAHIYIRVGRWNDAITANEHAVHTDESYIADQRPTGVYPIAYYPHNYHFLAFAATMAGRSGQAIEAARAVVERVPEEIARAIPDFEGMLATHHLALVNFGRWDDVLALNEPPAELGMAYGLTQYARGVALAAKGDRAAAARALETVRGAARRAPVGIARTVLQVAEHALEGEIALRADDAAGAVRHFREAARLEDELPYMEPPYWYYPIRHSLGEALLAAGDPAGAEQAFRDDLRRFPENGWALKGLERSLRQRGDRGGADEAAARFSAAWTGADVQLASARF